MFHKRTLVIPSVALLAIACSASDRGGTVGKSGEAIGDPSAPGAFHGHVMPTVPATNAARRSGAAAPETGTLQYYGGKVVSAVHLYAIYWGNAGSYRTQLDPFLQAATGQGFLGWLSEYDTPSQNIGGGGFAGSVVDTNAPAGASVDDSQIQSELLNLIAAGQVPAPDGNTAYFFFFPQGVNVTLGGQGSSCSTFCGYHDTAVSGSTEAYYGVLPDPATCGSSCDNQGGNYFADLTSVTTHELHETVTDAEVGIAIANSADGGGYPTFPNAWVASSGSEIGDLCAWQNGTYQGYNVQLEWSDQANACITPNAGSGADGGNDDAGNEAGTCGNCTSNAQCQSECPPVQGGGINCCDTGSGVCYATTQPMCPVPVDAGTE
jgi:hypothetical protein